MGAAPLDTWNPGGVEISMGAPSGMLNPDGSASHRIGGMQCTDLVTQIDNETLFRYARPVVMEVLLRTVSEVSGQGRGLATSTIIGGILRR
jgi:hypothetical protein